MTAVIASAPLLNDTYLNRGAGFLLEVVEEQARGPVADAMPLMIELGSRFAASINSLNVLNFESTGTVTDCESKPNSASGV